jgi:putative hydrolase of the HAD superfamily
MSDAETRHAAAPLAAAPAAKIAAVLFDFFGTLVSYTPGAGGSSFARSHALARELGSEASYQTFLSAWEVRAAMFDAKHPDGAGEYAMHELCGAFLPDIGARCDDAATGAFAETFIDEWNSVVMPLDGLPLLLEQLSHYKLAVVTNTHDLHLVPRHLEEMGIASHFQAVITSIGLRRKKPHPAIYHAALDAVGATAATAVFVGDTKLADYDGPRRMGMRAYLIDPKRRHDIDAADRLQSVFDLPRSLGLGTSAVDQDQSGPTVLGGISHEET